jgi:hypothetical protein
VAFALRKCAYGVAYPRSHGRSEGALKGPQPDMMREGLAGMRGAPGIGQAQAQARALCKTGIGVARPPAKVDLEGLGPHSG